MRSGPAATAGLLLALALTSVGCGEEQTVATPVKAAAPSKPARSVAPKCRRLLGEFLDAMESLNNTVAVGLDYDGYLTMVNRVRATYAEVDADRLPLLCLARAASPAEAALNSFIAAANAWGECLAAGCDLAKVEPKLQRLWARASGELGDAQTGLRALASS
ncbi:MAG TPA: hypothetical protein VIS95_00975 [Solirubrobacterales bacterium]